MSAQTFKARHCGETFQGEAGAKALEAHMKEAHGHKALLPGSSTNGMGWGQRYGTAAGWARGEMLEPTPWVAPKASPAKLAKVTADILAGKYDTYVRVFNPELGIHTTRTITAEVAA